MGLIFLSNYWTKAAIKTGLFSKILKQTPNPSLLNCTLKRVKEFGSSNQSKMDIKWENPPHGIFVQTLPIFVKSSQDCPSSVAVAVDSEIERRILLCKWNSGDFKDRYTGLIRPLSGDQFQHFERSDALEKRKILRQTAVDLLPSSLQPLVKEIDLVGILRFADPPVYDEYVYVANITLPARKLNDVNGMADSLVPFTIDFQEIIRFDEHPCFWFQWEKIPFSEMPADDELWYPKVLWEGKKVKGTFIFGSWSEKTIKSFELFTVDEF